MNEDAADIGFYEDLRLVPYEGTDGARGRLPDSRQRFQFAARSRGNRPLNFSKTILDNRRSASARRLYPIPCHARSTVASPCLRKRTEIGKSLHESRIELQNPRDLRLLEHDLRHQNPVRITRPPPWHVTPIPPIMAPYDFFESLCRHPLNDYDGEFLTPRQFTTSRTTSDAASRRG